MKSRLVVAAALSLFLISKKALWPYLRRISRPAMPYMANRRLENCTKHESQIKVLTEYGQDPKPWTHYWLFDTNGTLVDRVDEEVEPKEEVKGKRDRFALVKSGNYPPPPPCDAGQAPLYIHTIGINVTKLTLYNSSGEIVYKKEPFLSAVKFSPTLASLIAGSLAGAIGIFVSFPFDTLKTKSQVLSSSSDDVANMNMLQLMGLIHREEGLSGFFSGVRSMMIGQAIIKAAAFSSNESMLIFLKKNAPDLSNIVTFTISACFSGFIASFVVTPIERIKIMMQTSGPDGSYQNECDCIRAISGSEGGVRDLLFRGLGTTMARMIPSTGIYFALFGLLMTSALADMVPKYLAPLLFGAVAGCACWAPVYPVDVVKTSLQNTDGNDELSAWDVTEKLYQSGGICAFFDGFAPKMIRAAVNHAVTFWVYETLMASWGYKSYD